MHQRKRTDILNPNKFKNCELKSLPWIRAFGFTNAKRGKEKKALGNCASNCVLLIAHVTPGLSPVYLQIREAVDFTPAVYFTVCYILYAIILIIKRNNNTAICPCRCKFAVSVILWNCCHLKSFSQAQWIILSSWFPGLVRCKFVACAWPRPSYMVCCIKIWQN